MSRPIITLTTDFGLVDAYVGTMKGVILGICPQAALVDLSHEIGPQAIGQAAFLLHTAVPYFPPGTVHLVVVDPGVGSPRRPIAVQTGRATYVAPDNGVLSLALADDPARRAVHLTEPRYRLPQVSATFQGRDLFAPAAAHLAHGIDPGEMGEPVPLSSLATLAPSQPQRAPDGSWQGKVLYVDRFGNLITNLRCSKLPGQLWIEVGGEPIAGMVHTFADVAPGALLAYAGSSGYLEIAVREGSAALQLGARAGTPVRVTALDAAHQPAGPGNAEAYPADYGAPLTGA